MRRKATRLKKKHKHCYFDEAGNIATLNNKSPQFMNNAHYIDGNDLICLDGHFTIKALEKVIDLMKRSQKDILDEETRMQRL